MKKTRYAKKKLWYSKEVKTMLEYFILWYRYAIYINAGKNLAIYSKINEN